MRCRCPGPTILHKDRENGCVVAVVFVKRDIQMHVLQQRLPMLGEGGGEGLLGGAIGSWVLPHLVQSGLSQMNRVCPEQQMVQ